MILNAGRQTFCSKDDSVEIFASIYFAIQLIKQRKHEWLSKHICHGSDRATSSKVKTRTELTIISMILLSLNLKHFQVFHLDWRKIIYCMALAALFLSLMQPSSILLCCNMYKKRLLCDSLTVCVSSWTFHLNFNLMQLNCPSFAHFCIIHEV